MEVDSSGNNNHLPAQKTDIFSTLRWTLLLISLPFGILNFVLPIYGREVGASAVEIGLLFSSFSLMTVLLRPLIGAGLDRFGRRWFFIAGLAGYALTMLGFAYASTVIGLLLARVLQGAASSILWLAISALVADVSGEDERGRSFGNVTQVTNQGAILGTFLGFAVLVPSGIRGGWNSLFYGYAAAGLVAAVIAWRQMPETLMRTGPVEKSTVRESPRARLERQWGALLRSRPILVLLTITLITGASSAMVAPIIIIFVQSKFHAGMTDLAWAYLPAAIAWAVLPTRLGTLADRFGRKMVIVISLLASTAVTLIIPGASSLILLAVLWGAEAVCFAASDPTSQALVADLTGSDQRGQAYGLFALAGGLGAVIGPLAGGWLYDNINQAAPFIANGIVLAFSAALLWFGIKKA